MKKLPKVAAILIAAGLAVAAGAAPATAAGHGSAHSGHSGISVLDTGWD